jgi:L-threonylcarbamoyladenylate synthase
LLRSGLRVGWLRRGATEPSLPEALSVMLPNDPILFAAQLYAALHQLDAAGLDRLVVELPPDDDAWAAVRDRLRRASA